MSTFFQVVIFILSTAAVITYLYLKVVVWVAEVLREIERAEKYLVNKKGIHPIHRK